MTETPLTARELAQLREALWSAPLPEPTAAEWDAVVRAAIDAPVLHGDMSTAELIPASWPAASEGGAESDESLGDDGSEPEAGTGDWGDSMNHPDDDSGTDSADDFSDEHGGAPW
jgi:hypothetical protein